MLDYCLNISPDSTWLMAPESETARTFPFHMTEIGDFNADSGYYVERDNREGYQLIYTLSGAGIFQTAEQELSLTPGTAVLIHCPQRHRYATQTPIWHNQWIHFGGPGAEVYASHLNNLAGSANQYALVTISDFEPFHENFQTLSKLATASSLQTSAQISNSLSALMTLLLVNHLSPKKPDSHPWAHQADIANAADYIRRHYQEPLTLDDMAAHAKLSKYHFSRLFKKQMGETPYDYLVNCRISQSKLLLRSTHDSLDDISETVGYLSKSNFIAQFKALTGTTPARYRQESLRIF